MSAASPQGATTAPGGVSPPAPPSRQGAFRERGPVRHSSVHARRYRLEGTGKILGEVDVEEGVFDGMVSVGGDLRADRLTVRGALEVGGDVAVREHGFLEGAHRIAGNLAATSLELHGTVQIAKDVDVQGGLSQEGTLEVAGGLSARLFLPQGRFVVRGTLRAGEIDGRFDGESRVGSITASIISLRPKTLLRLPVDVAPLRPKAELVIDRIEAESVMLEGVTVHYLQARTIVLGRHSHVARAEGEIVRRDRSSHVGFESRSPPPRGLMR